MEGYSEDPKPKEQPKKFSWAVTVEPKQAPPGPVAGKCTHNSKCL